MKACLLRSVAPVETNPLEFGDTAIPNPAADEVLVRVEVCGVCRTDLHVVEGELAPRHSPVIPGHQVIGTVAKSGKEAKRLKTGTRVGIAWLHRTCQSCEFCRAGKENLCDRPEFTGYTVDGGFAEYAVAPEDFVYSIPDAFPAEQAAPLMCAGIIGFRSLRLTGVGRGGRLGLYGFGAAAHLAIQVARHWGIEVYAATRDERHRELALAHYGAAIRYDELANDPYAAAETRENVALSLARAGRYADALVYAEAAAAGFENLGPVGAAAANEVHQLIEALKAQISPRAPTP